jgi:hypothetical protein
MNLQGFKLFKRFNRYAKFNPPPLFLPRVAGEDEGGGLNGLNDLNGLNKSPKEKEARNEIE